MQWPDAFLGSTYFPVALASGALIEVGGEGKEGTYSAVCAPAVSLWVAQGLLRYSGVSSSSFLPCVLEAVTVFSAHSSLHEFLQRVPYKKASLDHGLFPTDGGREEVGWGVLWGSILIFSPGSSVTSPVRVAIPPADERFSCPASGGCQCRPALPGLLSRVGYT